MKKFLYETHLHTSPVSKCARTTVRESLEIYKNLGYAGVFITNHFIDGNLNCDRSLPYEERINVYFSDYEAALEIGKEIGISVFLGIESSYKGTDFLIYGLDKSWFLAHPEIDGMKKTEFLTLLSEAGAFVVQAHPYRESDYIDHIRLFPRHVHGVEIYNSSRPDFENEMAKHYAESYGLLALAGSDTHNAKTKKVFGGMSSDIAIADEQDFIAKLKSGELEIFRLDIE